MDSAALRQLMEDQLRLSRRLQARIRELEAEKHAPLAVVGMGLRLPGNLNSPEAYWDFLRGERTAYGPIPDDRPGLRAVYDPTPGRPGRSYVNQAGFLADIAHFDADFFGISQREAKLLDPQQRMLLETAWEALERAGIVVRRADRLHVGVYLGMMASEYSERLEDRADLTRIDPYYTTGGGLCFGAGRISFVLGFSGPVVSVDTACSSSLTALHLAVRGLRAGECRYALVCGANLLLSANLMVSLCQTRALSPDGRSKSFLETANGYGRGEGVGAVALMRLADAEAEGRPILAVIRGTALNHDGAASGLTAPNGPAQQEVIRAALADAGVDPADLGWIEAHGTGTALGDPIEIGALDGVIGQAIRDRGFPLALGSVKSRLGHLEAASGIAALMKTVLMLQHGEIPAAARDDDGALNSHIPWDRLNFTVPRRNQPWPAALRRRIASINSFGMSGTNAHAVLEAYQGGGSAGGDGAAAVPVGGTARSAPAAHAPAAPGGPELLTLSARTPAALAELAEAIGGYLRKADPARVASVCHTLRTGRVPFAHRLAVVGATAADLADQLSERTVALAGGAAEGGRPVTSRIRQVTLLLGADGAALRAGVSELVDAFPALAAAAADADPGAALAALIGQFGLRVRVVREPGAGAAAARLRWPAGESSESCPLVGEGERSTVPLLLDALARLFAAGAEPTLHALRAPGAELVGDLPTYPFQRRRFWVEEPPLAVAGAKRSGVERSDVSRSDPEGSDVAPAPRPDSGGAPVPPPGDRDAVHAYLLRQMKEVLHATEDLDPARSFLETGGDSFTSTLYITKVEEHYEIGLTPEDLPTDLPISVLVGRLADHISGADARNGSAA